MHEGFRRCYASLPAAPFSNDLVVLVPNTFPILADMCEQCCFLLFQHRGNIHICVRQKTARLSASINLKEIEVWSFAQGHAGSNREEARDLVIHMSVHR